MAKVAKLVVVSFMTRVVVDENLEDENNWDNLIEQCEDNIIARINNGELGENIEDVLDDEECPYDPEEDDNFYDKELITPKGQGLIQYD